MEIAGYIITVTGDKRPHSYVVADCDYDCALRLLECLIGRDTHPLTDAVAVCAAALQEHGVKPSQVKQLHL